MNIVCETKDLIYIGILVIVIVAVVWKVKRDLGRLK